MRHPGVGGLRSRPTCHAARRATLDRIRSRRDCETDYRYDCDWWHGRGDLIGRFFVPAIFHVVENSQGLSNEMCFQPRPTKRRPAKVTKYMKKTALLGWLRC